MRKPALRIAIAVTALLQCGAALAQVNPVARPQPAAQPEGFFRPTPDGDPSLTKYRAPPAPPAAQQPAPVQPAGINESHLMPGVEEQMDRSVQEAERDRAKAAAAPPPVSPGAYNGATSERDR